VVAADLLDALLHAVSFRGALGLSDRDRNTVDQKDDVGAVSVDHALVPPLVSHLEHVAIGASEVDQRHVAFAPLCRHEHRALAAQPSRRITIALDGRVQQAQLADDLGCARGIDHARIERDELCRQYLGEEAPGLTAAQPQRVVGPHVGPADLLGVLDHGVLDGGAFGHTHHHIDLLPGTKLIQLPLLGIVCDIGANTGESAGITNDVLVVVTLPQPCAGRIAQLVHPPGRLIFQIGDNLPQSRPRGHHRRSTVPGRRAASLESENHKRSLVRYGPGTEQANQPPPVLAKIAPKADHMVVADSHLERAHLLQHWMINTLSRVVQACLQVRAFEIRHLLKNLFGG
jgi:hypothetical protein